MVCNVNADFYNDMLSLHYLENHLLLKLKSNLV